MKFILNIIIVFISFCAFAQTPEKDLQKVIDTYTNLVNYSIDIQYSIYTSHNSIYPTEKAYGKYQKNGNNLRIEQYGTEFIRNNKYILVKDDSTKAIVLTDINQDENIVLDLKQVLSYYSKIEVLKAIKSTQNVLRVYFSKKTATEYEKADVYIDKTTNLIDEMVLYYARIYDVSTNPNKVDYQQPKMKMVYTKFDTKPIFDKNTFKVSKYIDLSSSTKNTLKTKYSSYEFYDQTQRNGKSN